MSLSDIPPGLDLSKIPLLPNPSGAPPNFINPPSLAREVEGYGISLMIISGIALIFRLWTNIKLARKLGLSDYLCIFAQVGGIAYWVLQYKISQRGSSRHAWDIPLSIITVPYIKTAASIQIVAAPTIWAAKSAILALYLRVFGPKKWLRITCYIWIVFMALFYGSNIVIAVVYCIPRKGESWDGTSFQRCTTSAWSAVVIGVFSVLADIVIFLLPFPVILKLRLSPSKKLGLAIVFLTGFLLVIMSVISLVLRTKVFDGKDPTWNGTNIGIVTFAEVFGTILVSCCPSLYAFWFNILTKSSLWSSLQSTFRFTSQKSQSSEPTLAVNVHQQYSVKHQYSTTSSNPKVPPYKILEDDASANSAGNNAFASKATVTAIPLTYMGNREGS